MPITDIPSYTALMEYMDMLYSRMVREMPKYRVIVKWWIEIHPPESSAEGVGYIRLHGLSAVGSKSYRANMHAIEHGARCSTDVLETVVNHHISCFVGLF